MTSAFAARSFRACAASFERSWRRGGARRDGALTGELAEPVPMSEVRARLVRGLLERACVQRERTCAYGDSIHDAPMLREVGRPCAVYPSRALRVLAQASGWRILG